MTRCGLIPSPLQYSGFPGGSDGKESTCKAGDQVRSLGWEDTLEKGIVPCSSILAWRIPWTEEPGGLQSVGSQRIGHNLASKQQQQRVPLQLVEVSEKVLEGLV